MSLRNKIGLLLGPLLFILMLTLPVKTENLEINRMAAIAILMVVWWITEAIPIPATSLIPVALFPVIGIMNGNEVCLHYMNSYIFLFLGGFIIALALERWQLHKRIALHTIHILGDQPKRIILGFMLAVSFLSMWISNTAAAMMMLPIAMSVISLVNLNEFDKKSGDNSIPPKFKTNFPIALMLAVAYGASIGGVGTLVGTPPNLVFSQIFTMEFPHNTEITFSKWLVIGIPFTIIFLSLTWFLLVFIIYPLGKEKIISGSVIIKDELEKLGPITLAEKRLLVIFIATAVAWIFRKEISISPAIILPGWSSILGLTEVNDGTVAIFMAIFLFLIPAGNKKGERLMDWDTAKRLPWGILLLFGGGFALAAGFSSSGLSDLIGKQLVFLSKAPHIIIILCVSLLVTFLTEMTSNTATIQVILPIMAGLTRGMAMDPLVLMLPATISASCAFMLPVATPPNAVIFGSGKVPIIKMVKAGIILNFVGVIVVLIVVYFFAIPAFNIKL